ncbi:MAG: hypothetical protein IPM82_16460 [Saprospiraceae bacterium]|nr:hypothetical protein [Saprospiraceae bacterium]
MAAARRLSGKPSSFRSNERMLLYQACTSGQLPYCPASFSSVTRRKPMNTRCSVSG